MGMILSGLIAKVPPVPGALFLPYFSGHNVLSVNHFQVGCRMEGAKRRLAM